MARSRVKLGNGKDCAERGLVREGAIPLEVAAQQLRADGVTILHPIGGDDTDTEAASLVAYLREQGHDIVVVGLPKTVDNETVPVAQSLGAYAAAEQGARFFSNVVGESSANPRMSIVHEIMGRKCGWLATTSTPCSSQR